MRGKLFVLGFIVSLVSVLLGYWLFGVFGVLVCLCVLALIWIEVIYAYGSKGPHAFGSNVAGEYPDPRPDPRTVRGWYDLDYRGRGKN